MKSKNLFVESGQLRQWTFSTTVSLQTPPKRGKCFLVVEIDGLRCDTLQESGSTESYFVDWLVKNSVDVSLETG